MHYNEEGHLVVRKNTVELIESEEAEYYFGMEYYRQYWEEYNITEEDVTEWELFTSKFKVVSHSSLVNEDFAYGMNYMFVIRRKGDGRLFGIQYFYGGGKYGESMFREEVNDDDATYSFKPVESFAIEGFRYEK